MYYKVFITILIVIIASFSETLSFNVNDFEAKTFNVMVEQTIIETPISQIDVNTDSYITFRGILDGDQVGKTLVILQSYTNNLEYHFICEDSKTGTIHSVTLDLFNKLIILDNDNNFIEVYYLELLQ